MKATALIILLFLIELPAIAQFIHRGSHVPTRHATFRDPRYNGLMWYYRGPSLSFGTHVAFPTGDFKENYGGTPAGFGGGMYFNLRQTPFDVGVTGGWSSMGSFSDRVVLYAGDDSQGNPTFSNGEIQMKNSGSQWFTSLRFRPFAGIVQVYGEGMVGSKSLTTKTVIEQEVNGLTQLIDEDRDRDSAFAYGWAVGAKYRIIRGIMAEARFENVMGGRSKYLDLSTVQVDALGRATFTTHTTNTDMYLLRLGISLEF
jgi:opacity protein-like surface antigen